MGGLKTALTIFALFLIFSAVIFSAQAEGKDSSRLQLYTQGTTIHAKLTKLHLETYFDFNNPEGALAEQQGGSPIPQGVDYSVIAPDTSPLEVKQIKFYVLESSGFEELQCSGPAAAITGAQGTPEWGMASCTDPEIENWQECKSVKAVFEGEAQLEGSESQTMVCGSKNNSLNAFGTSLSDSLQNVRTNPIQGAICVSAFLIMGLLISSMYYSGKNPLALFDITVPRLPRAKKTRMAKIVVRANLLAKQELDRRVVATLGKFSRTTGGALGAGSALDAARAQKYREIMENRKLDPSVRAAALLALFAGKTLSYVDSILSGGKKYVQEIASRGEIEGLKFAGNDDSRKRLTGLFDSLKKTVGLSLIQSDQMKAIDEAYGYDNILSKKVFRPFYNAAFAVHLAVKRVPILGKYLLAPLITSPLANLLVLPVEVTAQMKTAGKMQANYAKGAFVETVNFAGRRLGVKAKSTDKGFWGWVKKNSLEERKISYFEDSKEKLEKVQKDLSLTAKQDILAYVMTKIAQNEALAKKLSDPAFSQTLARYIRDEKYHEALQSLLQVERGRVIDAQTARKLEALMSSICAEDKRYAGADRDVRGRVTDLSAARDYIANVFGHIDSFDSQNKEILQITKPLFDRSNLQDKNMARMREYLVAMVYMRDVKRWEEEKGRAPTYTDAIKTARDYVLNDFNVGAYKWAALREMYELRGQGRGYGTDISSETRRLLADRMEGRITDMHNSMFRDFRQSVNEQFAILKFYMDHLLPLINPSGNLSNFAAYEALLKKGITWGMATNLKWNSDDAKAITEGKVIRGWISTSDRTYRPLFAEGQYQKFIKEDGLNFFKYVRDAQGKIMKDVQGQPMRTPIDAFGASVADKLVPVYNKDGKHWLESGYSTPTKAVFKKMQNPFINIMMAGMLPTAEKLETAFAMQMLQKKAWSEFQRDYKKGNFFGESTLLKGMRDAIGDRKLSSGGDIEKYGKSALLSEEQRMKESFEWQKQQSENSTDAVGRAVHHVLKEMSGKMPGEERMFVKFEIKNSLEGMNLASKQKSEALTRLEPLLNQFTDLQKTRRSELHDTIKELRDDAVYGRAFAQTAKLSRMYDMIFAINESSFMRDPRAASSSFGIQQAMDVGYHTGQSIYEPRHYVMSHDLMPGEGATRFFLAPAERLARWISYFTRGPMAVFTGYPSVYDFGQMSQRKHAEGVKSLFKFWENFDRFSNTVLPRVQSPWRYDEAEGWTRFDISGKGAVMRMPITYEQEWGMGGAEGKAEIGRRTLQNMLNVSENYLSAHSAEQARSINETYKAATGLDSDAISQKETHWYDPVFQKGKNVNLLLTGYKMATGPESERTPEKEHPYYINQQKPFAPGMMWLDYEQGQHLNVRLSNAIIHNADYSYLADLYNVRKDAQSNLWRRDRMPTDIGLGVDPISGQAVSLEDIRKQEFEMYEFGLKTPFFIARHLKTRSAEDAFKKAEEQGAIGDALMQTARQTYYYSFNIQTTMLFPGLFLASMFDKSRMFRPSEWRWLHKRAQNP